MITSSIAVLSGGVSILAALLADRFLPERIPILGSFVGLRLSHNSGIAFGMALPPVVQELLIGCALVVVAWMAFRSSVRVPAARAYALAYGLILGGGIANIIDRIPDGLVTDYLQVGTFPIFNVADSCITIGVGLLLLSFVFGANENLK